MGKVDFRIRNYRPDDLDAYARLHEEIEAHNQSGSYLSKQSLVEDLGHPRCIPEENLFVADQGTKLIGYFCIHATAHMRSVLF